MWFYCVYSYHSSSVERPFREGVFSTFRSNHSVLIPQVCRLLLIPPRNFPEQKPQQPPPNTFNRDSNILRHTAMKCGGFHTVSLYGEQLELLLPGMGRLIVI